MHCVLLQLEIYVLEPSILSLSEICVIDQVISQNLLRTGNSCNSSVCERKEGHGRSWPHIFTVCYHPLHLSLFQSIVSIYSALMFVSCVLCFMVILSQFELSLHLLKFSTDELAKCEFMAECYNFLLYLPAMCLLIVVLPHPTSSLNDVELKLNVFIMVTGEGVICLLAHAGHMRVTLHSQAGSLEAKKNNYQLGVQTLTNENYKATRLQPRGARTTSLVRDIMIPTLKDWVQSPKNKSRQT